LPLSIIVDLLHGDVPPFNPHATIAALAGTLQRYGIREVMGDRYAGGFVPSAFAKHGIAYKHCPLNASELYIAALPTFTSGSISLLDLPAMFDELVNLRRKVGQAGRESVQHMRGQHDDAANALVGLIHMLTPVQRNVGGSYGGIGVFTAPRTGSPGSYQGSFEDSCYAAAHGGRWPRNGGGSVCW
jgi:hypothetical protein